MHLYFANWGTRRLMFRLPKQVVDVNALRSYLPGDPVRLSTTKEHVVLDLCSETEEPEDDWFEAEHTAASLTPLRAELLRGDLRVAYIAWLLAVQTGDVDEVECEPPVPHGLADGSAPLAALVEYLRIDQDLLAAAAERSDPGNGDETRAFREWVRQLSAAEQQRWLLRAADHPDLAVGSELLGAFRRAHPPVAGAQPGRTVEQLLGRAEELGAARRRRSYWRLGSERRTSCCAGAAAIDPARAKP